MSNYGPTSFYPNHPTPPPAAGGYPPQSGAYPPQYYQRMPPPQDLDIYSPQYVELEGQYDAYGREREGRYEDYQYPPPAPESQRYHARMLPQYPEEIRYPQEQPPRDHYLYGAPSSRQQQQPPPTNSGEFRLHHIITHALTRLLS